MFTEKAINKNGTFTHSGKNLTAFGNHFDGENFYFFESDIERIDFLDSLPAENTEPQPETEPVTERRQQPTEIETQTENKKVELIIMQTHENTNVVKPTIIGKKPYYKSAKYKLNLLDYLKGFLIASLTSVLFVVQQIADGGTLDALNYKPVIMAAISGGVGYLLKNLFTDNSKK